MKKLLIIGIFFALWSCQKEDEPEPPVATTLQAVGTVDFFVYGDELRTVRVQVLDQHNVPMPDVPVGFEVPNGNPTVEETGGTTDANGIAYVVLKFEPIKETLEVAATAQGLGTITFTFQVSRSRAAGIKVLEGNNQEGLPGAQLQTITIQAQDDYGNNLSGYVKFVVTEGDGVLEDSLVQLYNDSRAQVGFTLSKISAINTIYAIYETDSVRIDALTILPPKLLSAINNNGDAVLTWEKSTCPTFNSYVIYRDGEVYATVDGSIETTQYTDTNAIPAETHTYSVAVKTVNETESVGNEIDVAMGDHLEIPSFSDAVIDNERKQMYLIAGNDIYNVTVADIDTKQIIKKIYVGSGLSFLRLSNDNNSLYMVRHGSNDIAVMDLDTENITTLDTEHSLPWDITSVYDVSPEFFVMNLSGSTALVNKNDLSLESWFPDYAAAYFVDYGKYVYTVNNNEVIQTDISTGTPTTKTKSIPNYFGVPMDIDNDGRIYTSGGFVIDPVTLDFIYTLGEGTPLVNKSTSVVYYLRYDGVIDTYDIATGEKISTITTGVAEPEFFYLTNNDTEFCIGDGNLGQWFAWFLPVE